VQQARLIKRCRLRFLQNEITIGADTVKNDIELNIPFEPQSFNDKKKFDQVNLIASYPSPSFKGLGDEASNLKFRADPKFIHLQSMSSRGRNCGGLFQ
jgi:hypothetical protein